MVVPSVSRLTEIMTICCPGWTLCVQLQHLRFLEWVGAVESVHLLSWVSSEWIRSMTRVQTLDAVRQLQHDAWLMTSNLNVLNQYALYLHGMASEMLELVVGRHDFPSAVVEAAAPVLSVRCASIHMEAIYGPLAPSTWPGRPAWNLVHPGPPDASYPACTPSVSGWWAVSVSPDGRTNSVYIEL